MLKKAILAAALTAALVFVSCSGDHGTEPGPFDLTAPEAPSGLTVTPGPGSATLSWSWTGDTGALGEFRVYYYFEAYNLLEYVGATDSDIMSYTDDSLVGNVQYCYVVSAVDTFGIEGWRTDAECATAGAP